MDDQHEKAIAEIRATGHLVGPWMPESRTHKRRFCLICGDVERLDVSKAPS